jgi:hypothetical protein
MKILTYLSNNTMEEEIIPSFTLSICQYITHYFFLKMMVKIIEPI